MRYDKEEYITITEAAAQWGVHVRAVQNWCRDGRVAGLRRIGRAWLIPSRAERPEDRRKKRKKTTPSSQVADISPAARLNRLDSRRVLAASLPPGEQRQLLRAELSKLRGAMSSALKTAGGIERTSPWYAGAQLCVFAAAGARGSCGRALAALRELENLRVAPELDETSRIRVETALAVAASSMYVRQGLPDWLIRGDFSRTPKDCLQMALYAWAKHLHGVGEIRQMLGVALTALAQGGGGVADLYLELMAVVALAALKRRDEAREYASRAARRAVPYGFLTPFAEHLASANGIIEAVFQEEWPDILPRLMTDHDTLWLGWASTRNAILHGRLNLELNARERQVALMIIASRTNKEIGEQLALTPTGVRQRVRSILVKLGVRRRGEIARFVSWTPE